MRRQLSDPRQIVAGRVPPWPDGLSRRRVRVAAICSILGLVAVLVDLLFPALAFWTVWLATGLLFTAVILLGPFLRSSWDTWSGYHWRKSYDDIRKLRG
jgi:hypothetical protein